MTAGPGGAAPRSRAAGLAPDVIHIGDRYYVYVAANIGAQPKAAINMIWSKTLDPDSPDYKWEEGGVVASSDGVEDCNAIDPGVFLDPNDGRLWLIYGSYFGYIRLVELDPKTGKRAASRTTSRVNLAINCEASDHDLPRRLVLPAGHARQLLPRRGLRLQHPHGPREEGDRPLPRQHGHRHDPGRRQAVRRLRRPRRSAPAISACSISATACRSSRCTTKPISTAAAPACSTSVRCCGGTAGRSPARTLKAGTYEIESVRTGTALELAVEGMPVGGRRGRGGRGGGPRARRRTRRAHPVAAAPAAGGGCSPAPALPIPAAGCRRRFDELAGRQRRRPPGQLPVPGAAEVDDRGRRRTPAAIPARRISRSPSPARIARWPPRRTPNWSCCPPSPARPNNSGASSSFADGTWRIMPKSMPNSKEPLALSAVGSSFATLAKFDPESDKQRWLIKTP